MDYLWIICEGDGCFVKIHVACYSPDHPWKVFRCGGCMHLDFDYKPHAVT